MLDKQVTIVTGGSKGIGFATAKALVKKGAKVGIIARNQNHLDSAVQQLNEIAAADSAFGVAANVANKSHITAAINKIVNHFGYVSGLVNNAGITRFSRLETVAEEDLLAQININFLGLVFCCQAAIPHLRKSTNARIINISSASVRHSNEMAHIGIYAATKAAVERFTVELREELLIDKIGVTLFSPGGALTDQIQDMEPKSLEIALAEWQKRHNTFNGYLAVDDLGESIAQCFCFPQGAAIDFVELRPNRLMDKKTFTEITT